MECVGESEKRINYKCCGSPIQIYECVYHHHCAVYRDTQDVTRLNEQTKRNMALQFLLLVCVFFPSSASIFFPSFLFTHRPIKATTIIVDMKTTKWAHIHMFIIFIFLSFGSASFFGQSHTIPFVECIFAQFSTGNLSKRFMSIRYFGSCCAFLFIFILSVLFVVINLIR